MFDANLERLILIILLSIYNILVIRNTWQKIIIISLLLCFSVRFRFFKIAKIISKKIIFL